MKINRYNEVLAETAAHYVQHNIQLDRSALRMMEIGAGTGGTSAAVLNRLKLMEQHIQEYAYTDVSQAFLLHGEQKYGAGRPFMNYRRFDVCYAPSAQQIDTGAYDVVIAANVLHATPDLRTTLRNVKALLKQGGMLLINEISSNSLFTHLTFGLLDGWWLYEDPELRLTDSPGVAPHVWEQLLLEAGFHSIEFPAQDWHEEGQQVIVAYSDGIVRQIDSEVTPVGSSNQVRSELQSNDSFSPESRPELQEKKASKSSLGVESTSATTLKAHVREIVTDMLSASLKVNTTMIDSEEPFSEYGVDSITGVRLIQSINEALSISLQVSSLFDYSSIELLSSHIVEKYRDGLVQTIEKTSKSVEPVELSSEASAPHAYKTEGSSEHNHDQHSALPESYIPLQVERENIAIVGMSGRFPQSDDIHSLWGNLVAGKDMVGRATRWDLSSYFEKDIPYCSHGGFLENIDEFDPQFFNISGTEAAHMDPHQRIFLEECWKSLEDAGYAGQAVAGLKCGVYAGFNELDYRTLLGTNPVPQAFWGNSGSVIPARIAYYLNLQGPAIAVDTACSSSLVSVHLACQGLWSGETEMALAGGVFIQSTPGFFIASNRAGMLSTTGRCHTFDQRADGFVPGEGAGVVVLKRLSDALRDRDNIHGVIRGTAINQDGASNGLTAPSAKSQEQLMCEVYNRFGIHPENIQLVEAHGTGTKLGDPIEYSALVKAFRAYTEEESYCALGSIKTNIGHTAAAAGVAGLIKILLSLKHAQIPASLHFQEGNEHISFESSPFYINTETTDWITPPGVKRMAAISAFGFSGTNAHMVIEQAPVKESQKVNCPGNLIVLSAQSQEQLRIQAKQLVSFCKEQSDVSCWDMSYTLLMGRKHMNSRLSCVVRNEQELIRILEKWLEKGSAAEVQVVELAHTLRPQSSLMRYGNECLRHCSESPDSVEFTENLSAAASLYMQGYDLDFELLFGHEPAGRISLPVYPFVKEKYWIDAGYASTHGRVTRQHTDQSREDSNQLLHPLLHRNTSNLAALQFSSTFDGGELFLKDHVVQGESVFPGAAYLEMARAAVEMAHTHDEREQTWVSLSDIGWYDPLQVNNEPVQVDVLLHPLERGAIEFRIQSQGAKEAVVHCLGQATMMQTWEAGQTDLTQIRTQCTEGFYTREGCYDQFKQMGLQYGDYYQGIEELYIGTNQVLAKLSLTEGLPHEYGEGQLHPGLTDSALQASIGLLLAAAGGSPGITPVPFALEQVQIWGNSTSLMWSHVRACTPNDFLIETKKVDIDGYDDKEQLVLRIKGLTFRELPGQVEIGAEGTLLAEPYWKVAPADTFTRGVSGNETITVDNHVVLLFEDSNHSYPGIEQYLQRFSIRSVRIPSTDFSQTWDGLFTNGALRVLEEIQLLMRAVSHVNDEKWLQIVIPGELSLYQGIAAMLRTAELENPSFHGQVIEVMNKPESEMLANMLFDNRAYPEHGLIRYKSTPGSSGIGLRHVQDWKMIEYDPFESSFDIPWKSEGVYVITGGAGALGIIMAEEIARHAPSCTIVAVGRTSSTTIRQPFDALREKGINLVYRQGDISDWRTVQDLVSSLKLEFGELNGIIHCAGIIHDHPIFAKREDDLRNVFAPKVSGIVHLDEATREDKLDLFIVCSAVAAMFGNPGQADYAAANAFMDSFASERHQRVQKGERFGRTISINWPLWTEGGMTISEAVQQRMFHRYGMAAMDTVSGIQALYGALATGAGQIAVLSGNVTRIRELLHSQNQQGSLASNSEIKGLASMNKINSPVGELNRLQTDDQPKRTVQFLIQTLAEVIGLPESRIQASAPLEQYGIDSILIMQMTNKLESLFGPLPKTLFFEYQTIGDLSSYFLQEQGEKLDRLLREVDPYTASDAASVPLEDKHVKAQQPVLQPAFSVPGEARSPYLAVGQTQTIVPRMNESQTKASRQDTAVDTQQDIAIIGVAGRYPGARNIHEFWENLRSGTDSITEIPPERWDQEQVYDPAPGTPGKTYGRWGGFLDGVDEFDPLFFQISPREAEMMDPQERLFMQCVYETLEDAGYTRERLAADIVGVYVGVMYEEYQLYGAESSIALSGNPASIANRVSYFCNFRGPSLAVDTMCSSSLTSIHLACQSLRQNECQVAVAGGVNVSVHPNKYIMLSQGRFLSSKGRCESFGEGGDGYVPGEGVGAVLLKPLARAVADGDRIYGVIKGSALNHGGKTNGYTVPNPNAQADVIGRALREAGVDPRTISYVEAHGTGTSLGDPIEIAGLSKAFQQEPSEEAYCAIGSAKSNIGHAESAAGIAGVTKVLLQLQHGELAPSLHVQQTNPHIDFSQTPFRVQRELDVWARPRVDGQNVPRRAGISSFGAGGANAHLILEEYREPELVQEQANEQHEKSEKNEVPGMVVLSARNEERLVVQARQLRDTLRIGQSSWSVREIAYTLQTGREAMEARLSVLAQTVDELLVKLDSYVEQAGQAEPVGKGSQYYQGHVKQGQDNPGWLTDEEDMKENVKRWLSQGRYEHVLDAWTRGAVIQWMELYGDNRQQHPRRISLPAYPFAAERYWVPEPLVSREQRSKVIQHTGVPILHPLVHCNTSSFGLQRYASTFTGEETILAHHQVHGEKWLPGTAYLEMARAAVQQAVGLFDKSLQVRCIQKVTWMMPLQVDQPVDVLIELKQQNDKLIGFEIYSFTHGSEQLKRTHCKGSVLLGGIQASVQPTGNKPWLVEKAERVLSGKECYSLFDGLGLSYGPAFQGLTQLFIQDHQVWAPLRLSPAVGHTERYVMNPYLLDAAFQASMGLLLKQHVEGGRSPDSVPLPFTLDHLEILHPCTEEMWVRVQRMDHSSGAQGLIKFQIEMYSPDGKLCIRMTELACKAPTADRLPLFQNPLTTGGTPPVGHVLMTPIWSVFTPEETAHPLSVGNKVLIISDNDTSHKQALKLYPGAMHMLPHNSILGWKESLSEFAILDHIVWQAPSPGNVGMTDDSIVEGQEQGVLQLFRMIKSLLELGYGNRSLSLTLITTNAIPSSPMDEINPTHASIHGFAGSLAKEYSRWSIKLLDLEHEVEWAETQMQELPWNAQGNAYLYRDNEWLRQELIPVNVHNEHAIQDAYRQEGVYVVIGGAGGIGQVWSEYMIRQYNARIIWIGRREPDSIIQRCIERLESLGSAPEYIVADATNGDSLQKAYEQIKRRHPHIHGVIHSAIVLQDQSIANMEENRFQAVLSAKVAVSASMAQVFGQDDLDFMLFFSSFNSFTRSPGQSNYAAGCTFKDAFAHQLARERSYDVKVINWGYWGSVGSVASEEYNTLMSNAGIGSIEVAEAMKALEILLTGSLDQLGLVRTTRPLFMQELNLNKVASLNV
ncbi:SDR family NAD(P)-dependent oxidoreductase [Paenibacillus sp. FSL K6-4396]|uniref:SDR family NAD(P)-dependent oxidoreductase n=1 Tax=Paenibacillus sp. FSL K6-4396 TaxID=2921506 RepID=UPI0030F80384